MLGKDLPLLMAMSPNEMRPFFDFHYGFRSSRSTADLLTVVFDKVASTFNRSVAILAVALNISKAFDRFWHAGLLAQI